MKNPLQFGEECGIISPLVYPMSKNIGNFKVRYKKMKNGIHPEYVECTIRCACGATVVTRSTKGSEMRVDICSKCHPFYTGKQKFVDAGGRLDKFKKRLAGIKQ